MRRRIILLILAIVLIWTEAKNKTVIVLPSEEEQTKTATVVVNEKNTEKLSEVAEQLQELVQEFAEQKAAEEKMIANFSEWAMAHDNSEDVFSIWKKTDKQNNLLIALKNEQEEIILVYKYQGMQSNYEEWLQCMEGVTSQDICDYAFTAYHEVGGRNPENIQAQVCVLINRQNHKYFADTIRGVVTEPFQYTCVKQVLSRIIKCDGNHLEREDLEKCFQQTILVLSGELIQLVPDNVLFAAQFPQGSGIWDEIDGTQYCYW